MNVHLCHKLLTHKQRTGGQRRFARPPLRRSLKRTHISERAHSCSSLSLCLRLRSNRIGDAVVLNEVLDLEREALRLRPVGHPAREISCENLTAVLLARFGQSEDMGLLDEALELQREALRLRPEGHSSRADTCLRLAMLLQARSEKTGDTMLQDEAMTLRKEVLRLRPEGHPDRADACAILAKALRTRFVQTGDMALLDEAIELNREALRLRPGDHQERAHSCSSLSLCLRLRSNHIGDAGVLDEVLDLEREALRLRPVGHTARDISCQSLATALHNRFDQTGDMGLLDEALELRREALRLIPEGHKDRASSCNSLSIFLRVCFAHSGHNVLLDEALELEQQALRLRPVGHPDRAYSCNNLATVLRIRFHQTGDMGLLDEALILQREALGLRLDDHPERAHSCASLSLLLQIRFDHTGDTMLLDEALELEREALRLRPEGDPNRAVSYKNLASALRTRSLQTGDAGLLDEALDLQRKALHLRPNGNSDRGDSCASLAEALQTRFEQTGQTVLLEEAIELNREALRLRPEGHAGRADSCAELAKSLRTRFNQTKDVGLLDEARSLCTDAIKESAKSPSTHVRLRVELAHIHCIPAYLCGSPSDAVVLLLEAIQYRAGIIRHFYDVHVVLCLCASVAASGEDHARLLTVYQAVIEMLPEMGSVILPKPSRLSRWSKASSLPLEALLQAVKANDLDMGLELLEQGRAVLWSETLAMQGPRLEGLSEEVRSQLQTLVQSLSTVTEPGNAQQSDLIARDRTHADYNQLQRLLETIRASPGLERFMRGTSYSELMQVASAHPVIVLAASDTACHALVLSSASVSPTHLVLNKISSTAIRLLGDDIRGLDFNVRAMSGLVVATEERGIRIDRRRDPAVRKLHEALESLWADIVKPILKCLGLQKATGRNRPRLHWCPVGALVFLPIHAAGVYSQGSPECCSDYFVSSYAPTLSAVRRACMDLVPMGRQSLVILAAAASASSAFPGLLPLGNVQPELTHVVELAQAAGHIEVLEYGRNAAASVREVADALPRAEIVHLACHGVQDQDDPLNSGFCLGDGKLTVSDIMKIKHERAFLAFLSACETAKGDKNHPDQVIHLAAAMLFCGFRSVVATMWSISDDDGPAVARAFYEALLAEEVIDADAVAYALDEAIHKLRVQDASPTRWASFVHVGA